jgi:hypothetical protein
MGFLNWLFPATEKDPGPCAKDAMDKVVFGLIADAQLLFGKDKANEMLQTLPIRLDTEIARAQNRPPSDFDFEAVEDAFKLFGRTKAQQLATRVSIRELRRLVDREEKSAVV